jgi:ubiquitin carboxyl-terminal hydrolase 36/42
MMAQDPARVKVKSKVTSEGTTLHGGSLSRHQGVQLQMTNGISNTFNDYGDASYPPAESPSPSESSSLFSSNSDAGSHSTVSTDSSDSTRNSTEEYEYLIFGTSDQMYPGGPIAASEEDYTTYSRSRSGLNTSSSVREAGDAGRYTEHRLQGTRGGWVEGDEGSSFLYTDRSIHLSSKLTEHYRQLDVTGYDPGETRGSNLSRRRSVREKDTQTFY